MANESTFILGMHGCQEMGQLSYSVYIHIGNVWLSEDGVVWLLSPHLYWKCVGVGKWSIRVVESIHVGHVWVLGNGALELLSLLHIGYV